MGAIVATLVCVPAALVLVPLLSVFGVSIHAVATFGGAFNMFLGLCAWWLAAFAGACIYAGCAYSWGEEV